MRTSSGRAKLLLSLAVSLAIVLTFLTPLGSWADGVVIVEPPTCDPACPGPVNLSNQLEVRSHKVKVTIADQVATTTIDQVFHNPNDWIAEGTYLFPIPEGAAVEKFTMIVDGEPVDAKILSAEEARRTYNDIVRRMKDPALLEYAGRGAIQASIFPIPPGGDRRIQIEYRQVLAAEQGLVRYVYPLNTERFSARPLREVSVHVDVQSADPVRAVYSPSHQIAVDRRDDKNFSVGWEATDQRPTTDFELIYTVSQEQIGANLLSYVDPVSGKGTFMLLAAPGIAQEQTRVAKDVIVVLDTSGSMEGEKLAQAKQAVGYVLQHLGSGDRFNIVEFSTGVRTFADGLQDQAKAGSAVDWVGNLQATGGTDINRALLEAMPMASKERPAYVIFLTDGLATEGETDAVRIAANVQASAPANVRLFSFGVGDDVDTILLDTLSQDHHGASAYVRPEQRIDEAVSAFYAKISTPVLTDVVVKVDGVQTEELYPRPLPDLFAGAQLVVVGSYRGGGPATVTLTGKVNGEAKSFTYQGQSFAAAGGDDFLPRLWATKKIGYMLNEVRLHGENGELIKAIVDLSVRYGIVTPYTSYLITQDDILTSQGREDAAAAARTEAAAPQETSGSGAVAKSSNSSSMIAADVAAAPTTQNGGATGSGPGADANGGGGVRIVGNRAFVSQKGVWIETSFDPSAMTTTKVQFGSDDYFALLAARPDLAEAFALGDRVIAVSRGTAFEVTTEAQPALDLSTLG